MLHWRVGMFLLHLSPVCCVFVVCLSSASKPNTLHWRQLELRSGLKQSEPHRHRPMGKPVPFTLSQKIISPACLFAAAPLPPHFLLSLSPSILRNAISWRMKGQCCAWFNQDGIELDRMRVHYLKALFVSCVMRLLFACWVSVAPTSVA